MIHAQEGNAVEAAKLTLITNAMNKSSKGHHVRYRKLRVDATQTENAPNSLGSGHPDRRLGAVRDDG